MLSGSGSAMNRFRVSSVTHRTDSSNQKKQDGQESQQHSFQLTPQPQQNVQLNATGIIFIKFNFA